MSPEKGGVLRTRNSGGRRAGFALLFGGVILAAPLLILSGQAPAVASGNRAGSPAEATLAGGEQRMSALGPATEAAEAPEATGADDVDLQLVRFKDHLPLATTTAVAPATATTTSTLTAAPVSTTTTTTAPPPTTTTPPPPTTTTAPSPATTASATGQATWYTETPVGGCASPFLPRGTEVTVVNDADGATISCIVDDREADNAGRVLDMSYTEFSDIGDPSQGVITVTITW